MAFVADRHVGTGRVDIFRKDILEAGLGDGYSGFYFPVQLAQDEAPESIIVKLEECDLALLHAGSVIVAKDRLRARPLLAIMDTPIAPRVRQAAEHFRQA